MSTARTSKGKNGSGKHKAKGAGVPPIDVKTAVAVGEKLKGGSPLEGPLRKQTQIPGTELSSGNKAVDEAALAARLASVASSKAQSEAHLARNHLRMLMSEQDPPLTQVIGVDDENKKFEFVEEPGKPQLKMRELKGEG